MTLVLANLIAAPVQGALILADSAVRPAPIALVVIPLMVAVFFLMRSLNKQLKRIDFDDTADSDAGRTMRPAKGGDKAGH